MSTLKKGNDLPNKAAKCLSCPRHKLCSLEGQLTKLAACNRLTEMRMENG